MVARIPLLFFVLALLIPEIAHCQTWQQFRGSNFGRTNEANVADTWTDGNIQWKTPLPGRGASSPVVFKERVYVTAYTGYAVDRKKPGDPADLVRHLMCLDVSSGKILWKRSALDESKKDKFSSWGTAKAGLPTVGCII
jgi:outer membrane protein assembly factor BamB